MPIDSSILLANAQPLPQVLMPNEARAQALSNRARALQVQEAEQGLKDRQVFQQAMQQSGGDLETALKAYATVSPEHALDVERIVTAKAQNQRIADENKSRIAQGQETALRERQKNFDQELLKAVNKAQTPEEKQAVFAQFVDQARADGLRDLPQSIGPALLPRATRWGALPEPKAPELDKIERTLPDGSKSIEFVPKVPGVAGVSAAPPRAPTNPTEATFALAAAGGDPAKAFQLMNAPKTSTAGPAVAPGNASLPDVGPGERNDTYLKSLPPAQQSLVKALAEGRQAFPTGNALRAPYWQSMLEAVGKYDPAFDAVNYNARAATRRDFTSGKTADQIRSINTAIGHLGQLSDLADALNNGNVEKINAARNWLKTQFGYTGPTDFDTVLNRVAPEITRVWRGTGGNEADITRDIETMKNSRAPQIIHGAIAQLGGMLESQLDSTKERYRQGMGTADIEVLRPDSRQTLTTLEKRAGKPSSVAPIASGVSVKAPDGHTYTFKTQADADAFKAKAGIK